MTKKEQNLSPDHLRDLIEYDPQTGDLRWKSRPLESFGRERIGKAWNARRAGKPALAYSYADDARRVGNIAGKQVFAHRVALAIYHGQWPEWGIDHIDGDPGNNRISNLRLADRAMQMQNRRISDLNTSGVMGVSWHKLGQKWMAYIRAPEGHRHLGLFADKAEAIRVRKAAEVELGYHPNHGRK